MAGSDGLYTNKLIAPCAALPSAAVPVAAEGLEFKYRFSNHIVTKKKFFVGLSVCFYYNMIPRFKTLKKQLINQVYYTTG